MEFLIIYLLKMLLCSAVLLGYYWVALRNERFHQWNRFYLLSAFLLSVLVPLLHFPLPASEEPTVVVTMVAALPWNQSAPAAPAFQWNRENIFLMAAGVVSLLMLMQLVLSVIKVVRLYRRNTPTYFNEVSVVITEERSAPFSFFRWLFWRQDIDPDSDSGQRMLQHELTHISEKHSADKLFAELLLIAFWMNPFFWLMRRELYAIHEFLADQKAIARYDGAAFAAMILQAAHNAPTPSLSNPFFTSHLKRRLHMITTSRQPKYSYLRRISGLVLMITTACLLVLGIEQVQAQKNPPPPPPAKTAPAPPAAPAKTATADSIITINVWEKDGKTFVAYTMRDGRQMTLPLQEAKAKGYPVAPPPPPAPAAPASPAASLPTGDKAPLYIYAGLEITEAQMRQLAPEQIQEIQVYKGEQALKLYGEKGRNGVVKITPRNADYSNQTVVTAEQPKAGSNVITVTGYRKDPAKTDATGEPVTLRANTITVVGYKKDSAKADPLFVVNGQRSSQEEIREMSPESISTINVLKGETAVAKYGSEGSRGVVEIITKDPDKVFTTADKMPSFPGGADAWRRYLERNIQYPELARLSNTTGTVTVQFRVHEDGSISDIKALNNPGAGLAEEAIRLIRQGPKWVPAEQNGQKVVALVKQPIVFNLK